jgi:hypothetical protein
LRVRDEEKDEEEEEEEMILIRGCILGRTP